MARNQKRRENAVGKKGLLFSYRLVGDVVEDEDLRDLDWSLDFNKILSEEEETHYMLLSGMLLNRILCDGDTVVEKLDEGKKRVKSSVDMDTAATDTNLRCIIDVVFVYMDSRRYILWDEMETWTSFIVTEQGMALAERAGHERLMRGGYEVDVVVTEGVATVVVRS